MLGELLARLYDGTGVIAGDVSYFPYTAVSTQIEWVFAAYER